MAAMNGVVGGGGVRGEDSVLKPNQADRMVWHPYGFAQPTVHFWGGGGGGRASL